MNGKVEIDIIAIVGWVLAAICGLLIWYLKILIARDRKAQEEQRDAQEERIQGLEARLKEGDDRMSSIEKNYIARFEEVNTSINTLTAEVNSSLHRSTTQILTALGDLQIKMLEKMEHFVTKDDCRALQPLHK